ncbi:type II secretion system F family protein [Thalassotalea sp. PS06]|uniref:type II secretion system F family protein n=1 Tax=Thalassotalea sp. PS06 TaxID=2594005 RepID=UPI001163EC0A|nr:type II secretion system F family protein [Thalassotalea sp. PS06]QDP02060.1 pilus assembly protein TadB [Thalassotalea sp. PS06]
MSNELIFLVLIFVTVIFLSQSLFVSVYNPQRAKTKELRKHLADMARNQEFKHSDLLLDNKINKLPPVFRAMESWGFIKDLTYKMELANYKYLGHQYFLLSLFSALAVTPLVWYFTRDILYVLITFLIIFSLFIVKLNRDIKKRLEKIEEEFPEALDVLKRGLQAGYAFSESLKLVCDETNGELRREFNYLFQLINYGTDIKTALLLFVQRVPITSAMAFASAISIQKETGGNLAEKVETLARVIRQRFTFKRRVRTLSAEGRMSAWILVLTPFVLFAFIYISTPSYLKMLISTEDGISLLKWGALAMIIGIGWINRLLQLDV